MTVYPYGIDDDSSIIRIDDNLSELGTAAINQLREAVFAIEQELGIKPSGAKLSVAERINIALNPDGTLNTTNLNGLGIATLPIGNSQVGNAAGIIESKLALDYSTAYLNTKISTAQGQIDTLGIFTTQIDADLLRHIAGATKLSNNSTLARHVASQIDINAVPNDARDATFIWTGIKDRNLNLRSGTQVAQILQQVNDELVSHENATVNAHPASAIALDATGFTEIPKNTTNVQLGFQYVDETQSRSLAWDRSIMQSNGIPLTARSERLGGPDGYSIEVVPPTPVAAYLSLPTYTAPHDSTIDGDDVIRFVPGAQVSPFEFDSQFTKVAIGDVLRIDYGNGLTSIFTITSTRYSPGVEWVVRIDGTNLFRRDGVDGYALATARIDRPRFETGTQGVFAVAPVIPDRYLATDLAGVPYSVIVGSPTGASAVGVNFNASEIDSTHYNLYLRLYPGGDKSVFVDLPAIDITGNAGATPGAYTLDSIVFSTNASFRRAGFNYRFIAFNHKGEFGLMLADSYNKASFSIINGSIDVTGVAVSTTAYPNNVVADLVDGFDALGFGKNKIGLASPVVTTYPYGSASAAATYSTVVITPRTRRVGIVDGFKIDFCKPGYLTNADGYWPAVISSVSDDPGVSLKATYEVDLDLRPAGLFIGKTIVVQPDVLPPDSIPNTFGRFIISNVFFDSCGGTGTKTYITVINAVHGTGNAENSILGVGNKVRLFFSGDSVGFDQINLVGADGYHRNHELFIDKLGQTFAIERARMGKQIESAYTNALNTSLPNWKIREVSPKLKGFQNPTLNFRRFVRFYVLAYNATTGEYDGYIGMGGNSGVISNTGTVVRAKKNIPTRFYDNSNVDYIAIEFDELGVSPGTAIVTTAPRYVDIEVFPSQELDDEVMRLAGVSHNEAAINGISDFRQFGTVSEKNFTDSAVKFIEAGERYLHSNGVIRGFEYITSSVAGNYTFNGGMALVNGKFVAVDAMSIEVPQYNVGSTFFICIDESGNLKPVQLATQSFSPITGYYIDYVTSFDELVDKRKSYTPIAVVVTNGTPTDARRFIYNTGEGFSWGPADGSTPATFRTWEAVVNWANNYTSVQKIVVKGIVNVTSMLTTNLLRHVVFEGSGNFVTTSYGPFSRPNDNYINVTADVGFSIVQPITFRNLKFVYNPAANPGDIIGISGYNGCIRTSAPTKDLTVDSCLFTTSATYLPPFITIVGSVGGYGSDIENISITNNIFHTDHSKNTAAIIIVALNAVSLRNVKIEGNDCSSGTIGIGPIVTLSGSDHVPPSGSFVMTDVVIRGNRAGMIGVFSQESTQDSCVITENNAAIITNSFVPVASANQKYVFMGTSSFQNGGVTISNNTASVIYTKDAGLAGSYSPSIVIEGNRVRNNESALVGAFAVSGATIAITADAPLGSNRRSTVANNQVNAGTSGYTVGIQTTGAVVTGNDVKGFTNTGIGASTSHISDNRITRTGNVTQFILGFSSVITDNWLSVQTIDGTNETTILNAGFNLIHSNINHVQNKLIAVDAGWGSNPFKSVDGGNSPGSIITRFGLNPGGRVRFYPQNGYPYNVASLPVGTIDLLANYCFVIPLLQLPDRASIKRLRFTSATYNGSGVAAPFFGNLTIKSSLSVKCPPTDGSPSSILQNAPELTVVTTSPITPATRVPLDTVTTQTVVVDMSSIDTATGTNRSIVIGWHLYQDNPTGYYNELSNISVDYVLSI